MAYHKRIKLGDIKNIIKDWDDEMSSSDFMIEIKKSFTVNLQKGIKCWRCGAENRKNNTLCRKCGDDL